MTQPRITAQYPSACLYTYGIDPLVSDPVDGDRGTNIEDRTVVDTFEDNPSDGLTTLGSPEQECINKLAARVTPPPYAPFIFPEPRANSVPLNASPSVTFSEPMDPTSLDGNIMLTDGSGTPVDVLLRAEGSSVVVAPKGQLEPDTDYTLTVSNAVTDLAGNGLQGSYPDIVFTTETMVVPPGDVVPTEREPIRQVAPFLTVLRPGMPCPLQQPADEPDSDFRSGGDVAGRCVGDVATDAEDNPPPLLLQPDAYPDFTQPTAAEIVYPVFQHPSNIAIQGEFSKPVKVDTVQLADGCLVGGGPTNTNSVATMAIQRMDGSQCEGVVDGELQFRHPEDALTRGFSFRPVGGFEPGQRYWIVICGSPDGRYGNAPSQCTSGHTIRGQSGLAFNTNSLLGTGTQVIDQNACAPPGVFQTLCFDDNRGQGGPDIVMPFDGAPATEDLYQVQRALPHADTNGNGVLDLGNQSNPGPGYSRLIAGFYTSEDRNTSAPFPDQFGIERIQRANTVFVKTGAFIFNLQTNTEAGQLGGGQSVVVRQPANGEDCSPAMEVLRENNTRLDPSDDVPVVGDSAPETCVPVDILPGGWQTITALQGGATVRTGRVILRIPYRSASDGIVAHQPQTGYIVPQCTGTFKTYVNPRDPENSAIDAEQYNYQPCFVANLTVTVIGNDGIDANNTIITPQQDINVQVFGPVAFEQNGRMVVSTRNSQTLIVDTFLNGGGIQAPTDAGEQRLQLVGPPIHGGPAQAFKVP